MTLSLSRRAAALPLIAAAALLSACGTDTDTTAAPTTPTPTTSAPVATGAVATSGSPSASPTASVKPYLIDAVVMKGKVSTPSPVIELPKGREITISVDSDVADELVVETYGKSVDVVKGETAKVTFKVTKTGTFDVELTEQKLRLLQLKVVD